MDMGGRRITKLVHDVERMMWNASGARREKLVFACGVTRFFLLVVVW